MGSIKAVADNLKKKKKEREKQEILSRCIEYDMKVK